MRISYRTGAIVATALILCAAVLTVELQARAPQKPWTKDQIIRMLKGEMSPKRVETLARERGIDFQITPETESELRRASATDSLLTTLRELAPKPAEKAAEIVVQTSPGAEVYMDDQFAGRASPQGRLVVQSPTPGGHTLRVSLAGKRDYEQQVMVTGGQTASVEATLTDIEKPKPSVGTVWENPKDGLKYVRVPPGTFMMGCSPGDFVCSYDEKPSHRVTLTKGFSIGQTPVTASAYKRFAAGAGRQMPFGPSFNSGWANDKMPIVNVTWDEARDYCAWTGGRLPTEAESEYAARGGSTEARYGDIDAIAWYNSNSGGRTHDVGEKRANGFGLFDALGNVWEWVNDWYDAAYYANSPSADPSGPSSGTQRVLRGGSWIYGRWDVRVSGRLRLGPGVRDVHYGFRCVGEVGSP